MSTRNLIAAALMASILPISAHAQTTVGVATTSEIPDEVVTYVQRERIPSVKIEDRIAVGGVLPQSVEVRTIPSNSTYSFAVVNDQRVIVEPRTRKIIRVIE